MPQPHPRINALSPHPPHASSSTFRPSPAPAPPPAPSHAPARVAPYMVALSGWPEPVYIESPTSDWEKRHSRPGTPRGSISGEVRDGVLPPVAIPAAASSPVRGGAATSAPIGLPPRVEKELDTSYRSSPRNTPPNESHWTYQTSSTRSTTPPIRTSTFFDPRLAPNVAVMQNRGALRVAPAWHTSHSPAAQKVAAGDARAGWWVMRSTPDVYPLPNGNGAGMARVGSSSGIGGSALATEVYPRDPDKGMLWADKRTPAPAEAEEEGMEVDR